MPSKMLTPEGEEITVIIYHGDKPHSVFSGVDTYSEYNFEWCKGDDVLAYHNSGGGGGSPYVNAYCEPEKNPAKIWIKDGGKVRDGWGNNLDVHTDAGLLKMGYVRIPEPIELPKYMEEATLNPFEHEDAAEGEAVYCSQCACFLWERWGVETLCDHLSWCNEYGGWTGTGSDEGECEHSEEDK